MPICLGKGASELEKFHLLLISLWRQGGQSQNLRSRPPIKGVLLGPGPESASRSAFWAILGTCLGVPQRVLFECFLAFLGPENAKKHSLGHSEAGAQNCPKSTPGGTFRPGP